MHQKDVERFAFLYLCGTKGRHMLLEKERMTFSDFERLTYLTDFFGLTDYNLDIWGNMMRMGNFMIYGFGNSADKFRIRN